MISWTLFSQPAIGGLEGLRFLLCLHDQKKRVHVYIVHVAETSSFPIILLFLKQMEMNIDDDILKLLPGNSIPSKRPLSGSRSSSSSTRIKLGSAFSSFAEVAQAGDGPQIAEKIKNAQIYYMKKAKETSTGLWIEGPSVANPIIPTFPQ